MTKKICPLMILHYLHEDDASCKEEGCAWWNENYKACGLRLATKKDGNEK